MYIYISYSYMLDVSWYIMISIVCLEKNKELELGVPPCYHRKSSCCGYSHHPWRMRHDTGWQREVAQVARLVRRSSFNSWQVVAYASILSFYLVVILSSSFQLVHLFLFSCLKCNLVDTFIWLCLNTDHSPICWPFSWRIWWWICGLEKICGMLHLSSG